MALTSTMEISGQKANSTFTYCYLYEPLRVIFTEDDATATKLYIRLQVVSTGAGSVVVDDISNYVEYDLNSSGEVTIDLMKVAQQYHDANVYKASESGDFSSNWETVVTQYKYIFRVTTDVTSAELIISKLPIIGGRTFNDFTPSVPQNNKLTEADVLGIDLTERWTGFPQIEIDLADPTLVDATPNMEFGYATGGTAPCAGMIWWKSRRGGWMYWGMDLKKENQSKKYTGKVPVGLFESTGPMGRAYVETDYTGIETSYTLTLKALHLTQDELRAVQSIIASPAVYYIPVGTGGVGRDKIELMKLKSAQAPLDNRANGGDFTVNLQSISQSSQNVR